MPICSAADAPLKATPDAIYPALEALYLDLHRNPELPLQEEKTAAKMAAQLRKLGRQVTEKVGGHGLVGVLRNGAGPTVMVRTDEYWLCCVNRDGAQDKWQCYLEPKARSLFGRNKAPLEGARPLMHALRNVLAEEHGISNVTWE